VQLNLYYNPSTMQESIVVEKLPWLRTPVSGFYDSSSVLIRSLSLSEIPAKLKPRIQSAIAQYVVKNPAERESGELFLDHLFESVCLVSRKKQEVY